MRHPKSPSAPHLLPLLLLLLLLLSPEPCRARSSSHSHSSHSQSHSRSSHSSRSSSSSSKRLKRSTVKLMHGEAIKFPTAFDLPENHCAVKWNAPIKEYTVDRLMYFKQGCFTILKSPESDPARHVRFTSESSVGQWITEADLEKMEAEGGGIAILPEHTYPGQPSHALRSLLPALKIVRDNPKNVRKIFVASHLETTPWLRPLLAGFNSLYPKSSKVRLHSLPYDKPICSRDLVVVASSICFLEDSLAEFGRSLLLRGCGLGPNEPLPLPEAPLLVFQPPKEPLGTPSERYIANEDTLLDYLEGRKIGAYVQQYETPLNSTNFCERGKELHKGYRVVVSLHGTHNIMFLFAGPGALFIEVHPQLRQRIPSPLCHLFRAVGGQSLSLVVNSSSLGLSPILDYCNADKLRIGGGFDGLGTGGAGAAGGAGNPSPWGAVGQRPAGGKIILQDLDIESIYNATLSHFDRRELESLSQASAALYPEIAARRRNRSVLKSF